jgi:hypothetical protein
VSQTAGATGCGSADHGAEHGLDFVEAHRLALEYFGFEEFFKPVEIGVGQGSRVHFVVLGNG